MADPLLKLLLEVLEVVLDQESIKNEAEERAADLLRAFIRTDTSEIIRVGKPALDSPQAAAATISALSKLGADLWRMQYEARNSDASDMEIIASLDVALKARAETKP